MQMEVVLGDPVFQQSYVTILHLHMSAPHYIDEAAKELFVNILSVFIS